MLRMIGELDEFPIFSIRSTDIIGTVTEPIIQPAGLKLAGFYAKPIRTKQEMILTVGDIREVTPGGIIVDDEDVLTDPEDLVRLKEVLDINYIITGKKVVTESKRKVGKVQNYAIDDVTWNVQKLYSGRSIMKDFTQTGRVIDRSQIIEVTDSKVVIKDATANATESEGSWSRSSSAAEELA